MLAHQILLGIDIDGVAIPKEMPTCEYPAHLQTWRSAIEQLIKQCAEKKIQLIPIFITAKKSGHRDLTTDAVMTHLSELFAPRNKNGSIYQENNPIAQSNGYYRLERHVSEGIEHKACVVNRRGYINSEEKNVNDILPAMHIVTENRTISGQKVPSKAHVLHHAAQFLGITDARNVFLIDDSAGNLTNLKYRCRDRSVPVYQGIKTESARYDDPSLATVVASQITKLNQAVLARAELIAGEKNNVFYLGKIKETVLAAVAPNGLHWRSVAFFRFIESAQERKKRKIDIAFEKFIASFQENSANSYQEFANLVLECAKPTNMFRVDYRSDTNSIKVLIEQMQLYYFIIAEQSGKSFLPNKTLEEIVASIIESANDGQRLFNGVDHPGVGR